MIWSTPLINIGKPRVLRIDVDNAPSRRQEIIDYIASMEEKYESFYFSEILTFQTLKAKGAIKMAFKPFGYSEADCNNITRDLDETKKDRFENQWNSLREKYPDPMWFADRLRGVIQAIGSHPSGFVVSPIPLDENIGMIYTKDSTRRVSAINMKEIDGLNLIKLDVLGLSSIELTNEVCKMVGIERLTPDNVDEEDEAVWNSMLESTLSCFQWESDTAFAYYKKLFNPNTIKLLKEKIGEDLSYLNLFSIGNAAIRPSGDSYRDDLASGITLDYGHEALNEFLAPTASRMVFQEQIIQFLVEFCGYSGGEADVIRRCVHEDTLVTMGDTSLSKKPIKEIVAGDLVMAMDGDHNLFPRKVVEVFDNGTQEVFEIETDSGKILKATASHKMMTNVGWLEVGKLSLKNLLLSEEFVYTKVETIKRIERVGEARVMDIYVETSHNYVANGLVVHNCIGKKQKEDLEYYIPQIEKRFIETMVNKHSVTKERAEELIVSFLQVIHDASDYGFSINHSQAYSYIGYINAYLRYYYPLEFAAVQLQLLADDAKQGYLEKSAEVIQYVAQRGVKLSPPKFGFAKSKYSVDKSTNTIFKDTKSIKDVQSAAGDNLYTLKDNDYEYFVDLLIDVEENGLCNKTSLVNLIKLNFFDVYGQNMKLLDVYAEFKNGKAKYDKKHVEKTKIKRRELLREFESKVIDRSLPLREQIVTELELLGYVQTLPKSTDKTLLLVVNIDTKYSPKISVIRISDGATTIMKVSKQIFYEQGGKPRIQVGDIIRMVMSVRKPKSKMVDGKWVKQAEKELWLTQFEVANHEVQ